MRGLSVRKLTPRECERLHCFPDDYTAIEVNGKPAADGPRYKALGNSMAVPCMAWIGRRIDLVRALMVSVPGQSLATSWKDPRHDMRTKARVGSTGSIPS